jgi:hypothetical protein
MTTPSAGGPSPADPPARSKKPGWLNWGDHPVVAVLAVLASVATIIQVVQGMGSKETDRQLVADLESSTKAPAVAETAKCTEAVGRWDWFPVGGVVAIDKKGTMVWYRLATDRVPLVTGTWECDLRNPRHYTFRWLQTAQIDTLVLSPDFTRMTGANLASGLRQSGTRAR